MLRIINNGKVINRTFDDWMKIPLDYLHKQCRGVDIVIQLKPTVEGRKTSYTLINMRAKLSVIITKEKAEIKVQCYRRKLPNLNEFILPPIEEYKTQSFSLNELNEMAVFVHEHLLFDSIYKKGLYPERKAFVFDTPKQNMLYGGKLREIQVNDDEFVVTTESGMIYRLKKQDDKVIKAHDVVVIQSPENYVFMSPLDFPNYFQHG